MFGCACAHVGQIIGLSHHVKPDPVLALATDFFRCGVDQTLIHGNRPSAAVRSVERPFLGLNRLGGDGRILSFRSQDVKRVSGLGREADLRAAGVGREASCGLVAEASDGLGGVAPVGVASDGSVLVKGAEARQAHELREVGEA